MKPRARFAALLWLVPGLALAATPDIGVAARESQSISADEAILAAKYAPIAELKEQPSEDADPNLGEPYLPAPVDVVLNDPNVVLRRDTGAANVVDDPVIVQAPTIQDLAGKGEEYYLDLPGDHRSPQNDYERYFEKRMGTQSPMVYAHIATEKGHRGIALQYWFFYVFNDFNNVHEGDWEMIQLTFEGPTVADALAQEPKEVGYAQHGGGEIAKWHDSKLRKEGDHPVVYVAAGSHAAYYGSHRYLGWGEHGSGVGCDDTTGDSVKVPLQVQLVPDRPESTGPFAWLTFQGRWGAKDDPIFAGPSGPNAGSKWTEPFSWQDDLRKGSLALSSQRTIGPHPSTLFCDGVENGAGLWTLMKDHAWVTYSLITILVLIPVGLILLTHSVLGATLAMFFRHAGLFLALGAVLVVLGTVANLLEDAVRAVPLGATLMLVLYFLSPSQFLIPTGSPLQQFIGWTLVGPAVIFAVAEFQAGRRPDFENAVRSAFAHFVTLVKASARAAIVILALFISIVGIPWAIMKFVRYIFLAQVVVIEGTSWRAARGESERAVIGRWWHTAALGIIVWLILSILAPLVGVAVLILVTPSVRIANLVSGTVYGLLFPLVGIAMTLWYFQRRSLGDTASADPASRALHNSEEPGSSLAPAD